MLSRNCTECGVCQTKLLTSERFQQVKTDSRLKKALTLNENWQLREAEILFKQILKNNPKDFVSTQASSDQARYLRNLQHHPKEPKE